MTAKHGQNDVPAVERLEDRLLFSAGYAVIASSHGFVEKLHACAEALMEKPCVVAAAGIEDDPGGDVVAAVPDAGTRATMQIASAWAGTWPVLRVGGLDSLPNHNVQRALPATSFPKPLFTAR